MNPYDLTKLGSFLICINIHYYDISDSNAEYCIHITNQGELLHDVFLYFVALDNNHCNAIFCEDGFLRFMLNAHTVICETCQKIFTTQHITKHTLVLSNKILKTMNLQSFGSIIFLDFVLSVKHLNEQRWRKTMSNLPKLNPIKLKVSSILI